MSNSLSDEPDLSSIKHASTRREVLEKRNSLKLSKGDINVDEEQLAIQNYWANILVNWCNVEPEDKEAGDMSIVIPTYGVTKEWIDTQKEVLEAKGYKVTLGTSSLKVTF